MALVGQLRHGQNINRYQVVHHVFGICDEIVTGKRELCHVNFSEGKRKLTRQLNEREAKKRRLDTDIFT